jgi:hypothetical protein
VNEVRSYVFKFCFGFFLEDHECFVALEKICRERSFNYDAKYEGATRDTPLLESCKQSLKKDGYFVNHAQVKIGSGHDAFLKGKQLLQNWGYISFFCL